MLERQSGRFVSTDPVTRFFENIEPITESGCWIWMKCLNTGGYGYMRNTTGEHRAHRFSWILHNGHIPEDRCVLHRCDIRACCNPTHLFLGSRADNVRDAAKKGRLKGIRHPRKNNERSNLMV